MIKMIGLEVDDKLAEVTKKVAKLKKSNLRKYVTEAVLVALKKDGINTDKLFTVNLEEIEEINNAL